MSVFARRQDAAIAELERTKMWPSNYAPPIYHFQRKLGMQVPPPHYMGFGRVMIGQGLFFGVIWGFFMWITQWNGTDMTLVRIIATVGLTGAAFGFAMALSYAYGRRKWKLTKWEDL